MIATHAEVPLVMLDTRIHIISLTLADHAQIIADHALDKILAPTAILDTISGLMDL